MGAGIKGLSVGSYIQDQTLIVNALRILDDFFELDGLPCYDDKALLAEALGCRVDWNGDSPEIVPSPSIVEDLEDRIENIIFCKRVKVALEVVRALSELLPHKVLMVVLPGPLTLTAQITGWSIADILNRPGLITKVAEANLSLLSALGKEKIDIVIFREEEACLIEENSEGLLQSCYEPLWNIARHYNADALLFIKKLSNKSMQSVCNTTDKLILPLDSMKTRNVLNSRRISIALANELFMKTRNELTGILEEKEIFREKKNGLFLVTNNEEVSSKADKEMLVGGIRLVRDFIRARA